jgi:RNA polymerase sigma-70 factor (ECF subfamily)
MTEQEAKLIDLIPAMRRIAWSMTRNRDAADDLVQATFERALRKQHLYQPTGALIAWVQVIMRNLFIDQIRRDRPLSSDDDTLGVSDWIAPSNQDHARLLTETDALIATLPAASREILMMIAVHGHSYEEAAAHFDIPLNTVRSRLSRARATLTRKIDPETPDARGLP